VAVGGAFFGFLPTEASGDYSVAVGGGAYTPGFNAVALGNLATAEADNSVAIGGDSVADREDTVSVGSAGSERQITNVAAGTQATDAVNLSQLSSVASSLGGGAGFSGGMFIAPSYTIQGATYNNVGAAFTAVDAKLNELYGMYNGSASGATTATASASAAPPTQASQGQVTGDAASADAGGTAGTGGNASTPTRGTATTTDSAGSGAVASGQPAIAAPTDATATADVPAAAASYADAGDANTLSSAQSYTDQSSASTLASAKAYADFQVKALEDDFNAFRGDVDRRFSEQDRRLDRMGAMSSAMLNMAINAAGSRSPRGRVAVGAGWQNGENALSVGYSKPLGERASFSIGGAFSGDEKSAGVGFGIDL